MKSETFQLAQEVYNRLRWLKNEVKIAKKIQSFQFDSLSIYYSGDIKYSPNSLGIIDREMVKEILEKFIAKSENEIQRLEKDFEKL